jgi:hypothetical protein
MGHGRVVARPGQRQDRRTLPRRAVDGSRRGARGRQRHGLTALKRVITKLGSRTIDHAIDAGTSLGRTLAAWRRDLTADLGGAEHVSTQQAAMIELAVRTRLMLDSVDTFIVTMPSLVNRRRSILFPIVAQRQSLARDLAHFLGSSAWSAGRRRPSTLATASPADTRYPSGHEGAKAEGEGQ